MVSSPAVLVVFGWAAFNAALAGLLPVFGATATEIAVYGVGVGLVTGFGAAAALAAARGHVGQQLRQPTRGGSAFLLAAAGLLVGLGAVYQWWIAAVAVYPLAGALALRAGERMPAGRAAPAPATTRTDPAPVPLPGGPLPYAGSPLGTSVPVPAQHPPHAAARPPRPTRMRAAHWAFLVAAVFRAVFRVAARRQPTRRSRGGPP